jgi:hypothetical protein
VCVRILLRINLFLTCTARDVEERDRWVRALEMVIHRHSGYYRPHGAKVCDFYNLIFVIVFSETTRFNVM